MDIEPTDEDIAEALRLAGREPMPYAIKEVRGRYFPGLTDRILAHATTLAKLRHAEELLAAQAAQIAALRRFADLYTVKLPKTAGVGVMDLNLPYIWNGIPVQTSRGGKI